MNLMSKLEQFAQQHQRDTQFLKDRGWKQKTGAVYEQNGIKCTSVWIHPHTGAKYPHVPQFCKDWASAVTVAEEDLLADKGWKEVRVRVFEGLGAFETSFYIHPKTKRLFHRDIAASMVRDYYNNEEIMGLLTNRLNELVDGRRLKEGDLICLDCENNIYTLW